MFYVHGVLSCVWCLLWLGLVTDTPQQHRFISEEERKLILDSQQDSSKDGATAAVPWRQILGSRPFLALTLAHLCNNCGWYMLLVELPLFAKTGLKADMELITLLASLPFLANWLWSLAFSRALDTLRSRGRLTTLNVRQGELQGGRNFFWHSKDLKQS